MLVRSLLKDGANITVYDNLLFGDKSNLLEIEDQIELVRGDILSGRLFDVMKRQKIEYVFHLAAEPFIPHSYENPEKFFEVNVRGTINVLSACKTMDVARVVHISSSEVYGTAQQVPIDENHPTLPLSTYAVSKLAGDRVAYVFSYEHKVPTIIVRPFNAYGPRETQPYVIPEIISQLSKSNRLSLGNIKAKRDFTYVEDTAIGFIAAMLSDLLPGEVVNIGSNITYSIEEIAKKLGKLMGHNDVDITIDKSRLRPLDVNLLQCDYRRINEKTGWKPTVDIQEGLKRTTSWYLENGKEWGWEGYYP